MSRSKTAINVNQYASLNLINPFGGLDKLVSLPLGSHEIEFYVGIKIVIVQAEGNQGCEQSGE